jgi:hypothetical protein
MDSRDLVRLTIVTRNGTPTIITSREKATDFVNEVKENQMPARWIEVSGRIDCVESNDVTITILYDEIIGFDVAEIKLN